VFTDPVFGRLEGARAGGMWQMLTERAKDLELTFDGVEADESTGRANWVARYTFLKTKRKVENVISAAFRFDRGLIVEHVDTFDFWRWSRQALGPVGAVLGWSIVIHRKVSGEALRGLDAYMEKRASRS
jgi:hypothetical protein